MPPRRSVLCLDICVRTLLHRAVQERHDLGSRAVVVGAEQAAADAAGDAILGGPCHRVGVIGIGRHITEQQLAALPAQSFSFTADIVGDFPETSYPADFKLTLKPGAQVMFIKNDRR